MSSTSTKKRAWLPWLIILIIAVVLVVVPYRLEYSGEFRVQPAARRDIRSGIPAQIERVAVSEGQMVQPGDLVVQLDGRDTRKALEDGRCQLQGAEANLQKLQAGSRPEDIAVASQKVVLARTDLAHAESALGRAEKLHKDGHVSDQDLDTVQRQRDLARETVNLAQSDLTRILAGSRAEDIAAQKAEVDRLKADIAYFEESLRRTAITNPIPGRITTLYLEGREGQMVAQGDVVATVEDTSRCIVRIALPEDYAGELQTNARVRIRPWSQSARILEGRITEVLPVVVEKSEDEMKEARQQQESGMVRNMDMPGELVVPVLAEIENEGGLLKTDMTGYAKIDAGAHSLGYALFHPIIRFFRVRVWSWIP